MDPLHDSGVDRRPQIHQNQVTSSLFAELCTKSRLWDIPRHEPSNIQAVFLMQYGHCQNRSIENELIAVAA
jgi:hypothetical protein